MSHPRALGRRALPALVVSLLAFAACTLPGRRPPPLAPLRISELVDVGDPARRASLRLVVKGLDADASEDPDRALGAYEQAIRVDATNPFAYLAIARHHAGGEDPYWALSFIDKADALFRAQGGVPPRAVAHLIGLRGQVLYADGRIDEGVPLLEQAWDLAPDVWDDGRLSAEELR